MRWRYRTSACLAALLVGTVTAAAQDMPQPPVPAPGPPAPIASYGPAPVVLPVPLDPGPAEASTGLESESLPAEISENIQAPPGFRIGPTPATEENFLMDYLGLRRLFGNTGFRAFGWVEGGYSGASPGAGLLSVQPRLNRFGNEFLLSDLGFTVGKPLRQHVFNLRLFVR